jgi:putative transposase
VYTRLLYTVDIASSYRTNQNVAFSCKFHIMWCPKYRRSVLVDGPDERLKKIIARVCEARCDGILLF